MSEYKDCTRTCHLTSATQCLLLGYRASLDTRTECDKLLITYCEPILDMCINVSQLQNI